MYETKTSVPTFDQETEEIGTDKNTIALQEDGLGLRVILGEGDFQPDLLIEKAPDHWRVFLHPENGADPVLVIELRPESNVRYFNAEGHEQVVVQGVYPAGRAS